jgi:hypothetical protein
MTQLSISVTRSEVADLLAQDHRVPLYDHPEARAGQRRALSTRS